MIFLAAGINIFWLALLAWFCLVHRLDWAWWMVWLAYTPLVLWVVFASVGRREQDNGVHRKLHEIPIS